MVGLHISLLFLFFNHNKNYIHFCIDKEDPKEQGKGKGKGKVKYSFGFFIQLHKNKGDVSTLYTNSVLLLQ